MDSPYRFLFAAAFAFSSLGFFSVLWVKPAYYTFVSRRLAIATITVSCVIGCGYLVAAYLLFHDAGSAAVGVIGICAFLNLFVLAVERPWLRRRQPATPERD